jgi:hypothetical protein
MFSTSREKVMLWWIDFALLTVVPGFKLSPESKPSPKFEMGGE